MKDDNSFAALAKALMQEQLPKAVPSDLDGYAMAKELAELVYYHALAGGSLNASEDDKLTFKIQKALEPLYEALKHETAVNNKLTERIGELKTENEKARNILLNRDKEVSNLLKINAELRHSLR